MSVKVAVPSNSVPVGAPTELVPARTWPVGTLASDSSTAR